jgi:hypothetical protein
MKQDDKPDRTVTMICGCGQRFKTQGLLEMLERMAEHDKTCPRVNPFGVTE